MSLTGWVPFLVIALIVFVMARYGGMKIWHAAVLIPAGIFIGLAPLAGPPISSFLSTVTKGRFP